MKKITIKNCMKLTNKIQVGGDIVSQARSWVLIRELCLQKGMHKIVKNKSLTGIEKVIYFLEFKLNK